MVSFLLFYYGNFAIKIDVLFINWSIQEIVFNARINFLSENK